MWALIWAALTSIVLGNTAAQECMGCTIYDRDAHCGYLDLTSVPTCLPTTLTYLDFASNDLSTLPGDAFKGLPNMTYMDLGYCKISHLPEEVFSYMPNLFHLDLQKNQITYLPDNLFAGNALMTYIVLSFNNLTTINPVVLNPIPKLGDLYVDSNLLSTLDDDRTFLYNTELRTLDLSYNKLTTVDKSLFSTNSDMQISLHGNEWYCDCRTTDLMAYFETVNIKFPRYYLPKCFSPPAMDGLYWVELDPQACNP